MLQKTKDNVSIFNKDILRAFVIKNTDNEDIKDEYIYLTPKNDYAIKGYSKKYGDDKFKEYFTFLNPEAFPGTNMCWRSGGIHTVKTIAKAKVDENYVKNFGKDSTEFLNTKDIVITIEKKDITDNVFFNSADTLAVSIYSSFLK